MIQTVLTHLQDSWVPVLGVAIAFVFGAALDQSGNITIPAWLVTGILTAGSLIFWFGAKMQTINNLIEENKKLREQSEVFDMRLRELENRPK